MTVREIEIMESLFDAGMSYQAIGAEMNAAAWMVEYWLTAEDKWWLKGYFKADRYELPRE